MRTPSKFVHQSHKLITHMCERARRVRTKSGDMVFTQKFFDEAMCFLSHNFPSIHQRIVAFEKEKEADDTGWTRHIYPTNMFTKLASAVIYQKVSFKKTTNINRQLQKEVGFLYTPRILFNLGHEWFCRKELDMDKSTADTLWRLIEHCMSHGEPVSPDDVFMIRAKVKGIGDWTVNVALLYCSIARAPDFDKNGIDMSKLLQSEIDAFTETIRLQRETDVYPRLITSWDPVVRKGLYVLLGEEMYTGTMLRLENEFGRYGGLVSLYMWWCYNHKKIQVPRTYHKWKLIGPGPKKVTKKIGNSTKITDFFAL